MAKGRKPISTSCSPIHFSDEASRWASLASIQTALGDVAEIKDAVGIGS